MLYSKAANNGHRASMYNLAKFYQSGTGEKKKKKKFFPTKNVEMKKESKGISKKPLIYMKKQQIWVILMLHTILQEYIKVKKKKKKILKKKKNLIYLYFVFV